MFWTRIELWIGFNVLIVALLLVDLLVVHRRPHEARLREAFGWSAVWIALGLAFTGVVYLVYQEAYDPVLAAEAGRRARIGTVPGGAAALQYLTGYLIEKSLSVDNLFVFLLVFRYFSVPPVQRHRVLFWGILGALVFRGLFIFAGVALIERFEWMLYLLGALLVVTGIRMGIEEEKEVHPERNPVLRLLRRVVPVTHEYHGAHFFIRRHGRLVATPLFVTLCALETTDIIFAVDSIPAVLAVSTDPFIVYTSNVFAILGLRALYFALAGFMDLFAYLHYGLAAVLIFVGGKMLTEQWLVEIPTGVSLAVVATILTVSVVVSVWLAPTVAPEDAAAPVAGPPAERE